MRLSGLFDHFTVITGYIYVELRSAIERDAPGTGTPSSVSHTGLLHHPQLFT